MSKRVFAGVFVFLTAVACWQVSTISQSAAPERKFLNQYCTGCHNDDLKAGGMTLSKFDLNHIDQDPRLAEKIIYKLRSGLMPPPGVPLHSPPSLKKSLTKPPLLIRIPAVRTCTASIEPNTRTQSATCWVCRST
jgi:hypothetical protein